MCVFNSLACVEYSNSILSIIPLLYSDYYRHRAPALPPHQDHEAPVYDTVHVTSPPVRLSSDQDSHYVTPPSSCSPNTGRYDSPVGSPLYDRPRSGQMARQTDLTSPSTDSVFHDGDTTHQVLSRSAPAGKTDGLAHIFDKEVAVPKTKKDKSTPSRVVKETKIFFGDSGPTGWVYKTTTSYVNMKKEFWPVLGPCPKPPPPPDPSSGSKGSSPHQEPPPITPPPPLERQISVPIDDEYVEFDGDRVLLSREPDVLLSPGQQREQPDSLPPSACTPASETLTIPPQQGPDDEYVQLACPAPPPPTDQQVSNPTYFLAPTQDQTMATSEVTLRSHENTRLLTCQSLRNAGSDPTGGSIRSCASDAFYTNSLPTLSPELRARHFGCASSPEQASSTLETTRRAFSTLDTVPLNVRTFGISEVSACLRLLKLERYVDVMRAQNVDGQLLVNMNERMLMEEFGFSEFNARKLMMFAKENWRPTERMMDNLH